MRRLVLLMGPFALLAVLLACKRRSIDDVVAEHRVPVEAKLAEMGKLNAVAKSAPRLTADAIQLAPEQIVVDPDEKANALLVHLEDLATPGTAGTVSFRTVRAKTLVECGSLI